MRDIREDLKERLASIRNELDGLTKRQELLSAMQQSLFGLLEEEERRFRSAVPSLVAVHEPEPEPAPMATFEPITSGFSFAEVPSTPKPALDSWAELRSGRR